MANPNVNRTNVIISPADETTINTAFGTLETTINPYTHALTDDERESFFSLAQENEIFSDDALEQGRLLSAQMPPAMQLIINNMVNDDTLHEQLDLIENTQLNPLAQRIKDTKRLAAHEKYSAALAIYKFIEAGSQLGLPGFQAAYDVLKVRFEGQGRPAGENP